MGWNRASGKRPAQGGVERMNLHGACYARDLVVDVGLMYWGSLLLEKAHGNPVILAPAFAEKEKPDLAVGASETNRELPLPERV